jgi:hypothetical protein
MLMACPLDIVRQECHFTSVFLLSKTHNFSLITRNIIRENPLDEQSTKYLTEFLETVKDIRIKQGKFEKLSQPRGA